MPDSIKYKKYGLLLDPNDSDDKKLIQFLEDKHGQKRKDSYSAILRKALKLLMEQEGFLESGDGDE